MITGKKHLLHFYYGNKIDACYTALGTGFRAMGHNLSVTLVIKKNCSTSIDIEIKLRNYEIDLLTVERLKSLISLEEKRYLSSDCLVVLDFNLYFIECRNKGYLLDLLKKVKKHSEVILVSSEYIAEVESISDYISCFTIQ